jgi:hypothetical protein
VSDPRLRLMDLLAGLSLATDLGMGQPPETALRCCVLATWLARALDLPEDDVRDVFLGSLLRHLGCTATAAIEARQYGGGELVSRSAAQPADFGDPREMLALTLATGRGAGVRRPFLVARGAFGDLLHGKEILTIGRGEHGMRLRRVTEATGFGCRHADEGPSGATRGQTPRPGRWSGPARLARG